jgi:biopolymer transport protein ExbD
MSGFRRSQQEVELNMASMLDMAFQLLTFFILTFRPPPIEGSVALRLPPPQAIKGTGHEKAGQVDKKDPQVEGVSTLVISVFSQTGSIDQLGVGENEVKGLPQLARQLDSTFKDANNPFDQVIIQCSARLRYGELMKVVEICTHQTLPDGKKLGKLSFVMIPDEAK